LKRNNEKRLTTKWKVQIAFERVFLDENNVYKYEMDMLSVHKNVEKLKNG
jgi:hypothetical protein